MKEKIQVLLKQITKQDKLIIILTFSIGLLNFLYLLSNNVLSPDGLAYGPIYKSNGWEVDLGRPLLLIIDRLRGGLVSAPIILFVALINISITTMLLRRIYDIKKTLSIIILSLLLVLFPTLSESALFIYCFDSYSFSLLFSVLAIYFIKKEKPIYAILFIIASLSLYQAYISITLSGVFILTIQELLHDDFNLKKLIQKIGIVFLGLVSYFILLKGGMWLFGRQMANYKGANSFGLDTILSLPKSIMHSYSDYYSYFFKETIIFNSYYLRHIINTLLFILFLVCLIKPFKNSKASNKVFFILILITLPIATNIMDLIACDTTINLVTGIGFVMTYILGIILFEKNDIKIVKYLGYTFLFLLSYTFLLSNNGTFMAREDTYKNYYYESMNLLTKAKQLEDYNPEYQWMMSDIIRYQSDLVKASNGYLSKDYETYDNYFGILETEIFFDHYFGERIVMVDYDTYKEIANTEEYKNMKLGEVKIINSTIVCKISEDLAF